MKKLIVLYFLSIFACMSLFAQKQIVQGHKINITYYIHLIVCADDESNWVLDDENAKCVITQHLSQGNKIISFYVIYKNEKLFNLSWNSKYIRIERIKEEDGTYTYLIRDNHYMYVALMTKESGVIIKVTKIG